MTSLKRRFAMLSVVLAAFALAGTTGLCAEDTSSVDYQKVADGARWGFSDAADNPLFCMRRAGTDYDVWLLREAKNRHALTIKIIKNDRPVYQWKGHKHSVFRIQGDRLYYAEFHYSSTGGHVVAVDLTSGEPLWRTPLKALGGVEHSAYLNRMTIDANDEVVSIYGNESMGRYLEFKDAKTGKTVGHKRFPKQVQLSNGRQSQASKPPLDIARELLVKTVGGKWKKIRSKLDGEYLVMTKPPQGVQCGDYYLFPPPTGADDERIQSWTRVRDAVHYVLGTGNQGTVISSMSNRHDSPTSKALISALNLQEPGLLPLLQTEEMKK